jgi:hypothetical protein
MRRGLAVTHLAGLSYLDCCLQAIVLQLLTAAALLVLQTAAGGAAAGAQNRHRALLLPDGRGRLGEQRAKTCSGLRAWVTSASASVSECQSVSAQAGSG